jgi:outer membrane murein-binding lipoprotein Lpp
MNFKDAKGFIIGAIVVASGLSALAISIPNAFTAGSTIKASDINTNFTALKTATDALEAKVATLEANAKGPTSKGSLRAFVIANGAAAISNQYSSTGGNITVTSTGTGVYAVAIPGLSFFYRDHPAVVTPLSDGNNVCYPASYGTTSANVRCYDDTGAPANTSFSLLVFNK